MTELVSNKFEWTRTWVNPNEDGVPQDFEFVHPDGCEIFFDGASSSYHLTIPVFSNKPHTLSLRSVFSYTAEFDFEFGRALTAHLNQTDDSALHQLVRYTYGEIMDNYTFDLVDDEKDVGQHLIGQIWTNGRVTAAITGFFRTEGCATITWNALKFNANVFFTDKQRVV